MSPYVAFNNDPIYYVDPLGLEGEKPYGTFVHHDGTVGNVDTKEYADWLEAEWDVEVLVTAVELPVESTMPTDRLGVYKPTPITINEDANLYAEPKWFTNYKIFMNKLDRATKGNSETNQEFGLVLTVDGSTGGYDIGFNKAKIKEECDITVLLQALGMNGSGAFSKVSWSSVHKIYASESLILKLETVVNNAMGTSGVIENIDKAIEKDVYKVDSLVNYGGYGERYSIKYYHLFGKPKSDTIRKTIYWGK